MPYSSIIARLISARASGRRRRLVTARRRAARRRSRRAASSCSRAGPLGHQVTVLLGNVQLYPAPVRAARSRSCGRVDSGGNSSETGRTGLVVGDDPSRSAGSRGCLEAGDHALERPVEVGRGDRRTALAAGEDRRLVADVGEVRAGEPDVRRATTPRSTSWTGLFACAPSGSAGGPSGRGARPAPAGRNGPVAAAPGPGPRPG